MSRYIDADAFVKELEVWHRNALAEKAELNAFFSSNFIDMVNMMPTVDAVPVRHGKWEMKPDPYGFFDEIPVCSECGCTTKMREKTKYCPHCGARMDEE